VQDDVRVFAASPLPRVRHVEDDKQITLSLSRLPAAYVEFVVQGGRALSATLGKLEASGALLFRDPHARRAV
jgi:hypothetical protein